MVINDFVILRQDSLRLNSLVLCCFFYFFFFFCQENKKEEVPRLPLRLWSPSCTMLSVDTWVNLGLFVLDQPSAICWTATATVDTDANIFWLLMGRVGAYTQYPLVT